MIKRRQWKWIGHTSRKKKENATRITIKWKKAKKFSWEKEARKTKAEANGNQRAGEHREDMG